MDDDSTPVAASDKDYWHRFSDFYERIMPNAGVTNILEFGVFHGESIRWLRHKYPAARIVGFDILPIQADWPVGDGISYLEGDQGNPELMSQLISSCQVNFDLVIEDGSHDPLHQRDALLCTLPYLAPGGLFILEDAHTSFRELRDHRVISGSPYTRTARGRAIFAGVFERLVPKPRHVNILTCLLAIEHARSLCRSLNESEIDDLCRGGFIAPSDLQALDSRIASLEFYHRISLPIQCHRCRGSEFHFTSMTCKCGIRLMDYDDSMTVAISVK